MVDELVVAGADGGDVVEVKDVADVRLLQLEGQDDLVTLGDEVRPVVYAEDGVEVVGEAERAEVCGGGLLVEHGAEAEQPASRGGAGKRPAGGCCAQQRLPEDW